MTSSRPYLVRAVHEWIVDNGCTPQLVVDATQDGVDVPRAFVEDGRIVLNLAASAVRGLVLGSQLVEFDARFAGDPHHVTVPMRAVLAMVARENGAGMSFPDEDSDEDPPPSDDDKPSRPALRVVK